MIHMIHTCDTYMQIMHLGVFQLFTPQNLHLRKRYSFFRNPLDEIYLPRGFLRVEKVNVDEFLTFLVEFLIFSQKIVKINVDMFLQCKKIR